VQPRLRTIAYKKALKLKGIGKGSNQLGKRILWDTFKDPAPTGTVRFSLMFNFHILYHFKTNINFFAAILSGI
jgi:hypothetical protein